MEITCILGVSNSLEKKSGECVTNFRDKEQTCTRSFAQDKLTYTHYSRLMIQISRLMPCNIIDYNATESKDLRLVD